MAPSNKKPHKSQSRTKNYHKNSRPSQNRSRNKTGSIKSSRSRGNTKRLTSSFDIFKHKKVSCDKKTLKKLEKVIRKNISLKSKYSKHSGNSGNPEKTRKSRRTDRATVKDSKAAKSSDNNEQNNDVQNKVKRPRRSKSSTRFTHVKKSRSKQALQEEASGSNLIKSKSKLKIDIDDVSLSMLKALESPQYLAHVEVCAKADSTARVREIKNRLKHILKKRSSVNTKIPYERDTYLVEHIKSLVLLPSKSEKKNGTCSDTNYQIHVYQLNDDGPATDDWEEEDMATAKHWLLPNEEFNGVWENLVFEEPVKETLLNYAITMLMYGDRNIDRNVICCNRVVLLHGPPGTGKTSLCKALAQKLCIRMSHKYKYGLLVEINSHGLFSKWFSESGKLVVKMFQKIHKFVGQKDTLICILIDEVESLAAARKHMMNGNEPSDSMRVVNALLTQLDAVQRNPNVLVLTTSNVTGALELAFVDRADIKLYIGPPNTEAIYAIYRDCIIELMNKHIITQKVDLLRCGPIDKKKTDQSHKHSDRLWNLAKASDGLSGRSLRKIPFLSHANYVMAPSVDLNTFWNAMQQCIANQHRERENLVMEPEL